MKLADFNPSRVETQPKKTGWQPPHPFHYPQCRLLCFDQSITATGWVLVEVDDQRRFVVLAAGKIGREPTDDKGVSGTLNRATEVAEEIDALMGVWATGFVHVVHEAPPAGGSKLFNTESSMLTALAVRIAARKYGLDYSMHSAQKAKFLLTGDRTASKADVRKGLEIIPTFGYNLIKNEAQRDALALAHVELSERAKESRGQE